MTRWADLKYNSQTGGEVEKPTVYIAGPMRGYPQFNFPAFDKARDKFRGLGFEVISPADLDRGSGFNETEDLSPAALAAMTDTFIDRDVAAIRKLRRDSDDGLVLLSNWERSTGAKAEVGLALWRGLKFYDAETGAVIYPVLSGGHY